MCVHKGKKVENVRHRMNGPRKGGGDPGGMGAGWVVVGVTQGILLLLLGVVDGAGVSQHQGLMRL